MEEDLEVILQFLGKNQKEISQLMELIFYFLLILQNFIKIQLGIIILIIMKVMVLLLGVAMIYVLLMDVWIILQVILQKVIMGWLQNMNWMGYKVLKF